MSAGSQAYVRGGAATVTAWLVALIGPPAVAWAGRGRWNLGLLLAILAFAAGLVVVAKAIGALA